MAKKTKSPSFHSQHDGYTVPVVATSPDIKRSPGRPTVKQKDNAMPERKHAGRVWNQNRPMKKPASTIANFSDGGEYQYPKKAKKPHGKGPRGGLSDIYNASTNPGGAHTSYGAS